MENNNKGKNADKNRDDSSQIIIKKITGEIEILFIILERRLMKKILLLELGFQDLLKKSI